MLAWLKICSAPFEALYQTLPDRYSRLLFKKAILHVGDGRSPNASLNKGLGVITSDLLLSDHLGFTNTSLALRDYFPIPVNIEEKLRHSHALNN